MELTRTEFRILHILASCEGDHVVRNDLYEGVWGKDVVVNHRSIDVHMASLRKKLPPQWMGIKSIYGVGYRFMNELPRNIESTIKASA